MDVLVSFRLSNNFGFLKTVVLGVGRGEASNRGRNSDGAHLTHRIRILCIYVLEHRVDLTLKLQFATLCEIQPRGVDNGKQHPIEPRLAYFDARGLDSLSGLCRPFQKLVHSRLLVRRCPRRSVRGFQQQPEK